MYCKFLILFLPNIEIDTKSIMRSDRLYIYEVKTMLSLLVVIYFVLLPITRALHTNNESIQMQVSVKKLWQ